MGDNKNNETNNTSVCSVCGATIREGIKFCTSCGTPVDQATKEVKEEATVEEKTEAVVEAVEEKAEATEETMEEKAEEVVEDAKEEVEETVAESTEAVKETVNETINETPVQPVTPTPVQPTTPTSAGTPGGAGTNEIVEKIKGLGTTKIAAIAGGILVVIMVAVMLISGHKEKINLEDYIKVEVDGYNGSGTAEVEWKESLDKAIVKALGYDEDDVKDLTDSESLEIYNEYKEVMDAIEFKVDKEENLSNGDKITVKITYDNKEAKEHGIKFTGEKYVMTVKGLEELRGVDPFDGLEVTYSGKSPNASVRFEYKGEEDFINGYYFKADKEDGLRVGDKITVTCEVPDYAIDDKGVKITSTTKEYTVENVEAYLEKLADVESKVLTDIKTETEDVVNAYFTKEKDSLKKDELKYEGLYVLTKKDEDTWYGYNTVYVIYSANVSCKVKSGDKKFKTTKVYFPVKFTEVIEGLDGKVTWKRYDYDDIQGKSGLEYGWFGEVEGYADGKDMYDELIGASKADYNYEISPALQAFGN